MNKILSTGIILLASLSLPACQSHSAKSTTKPETPTVKTIKMADFNQIKVGDDMTGDGGLSKIKVFKLLGKPTSHSKISYSLDHDEVIDYTWKKADKHLGEVMVSFIGNKVSEKKYLGAILQRPKKITLADARAIQTGASVTSVEKTLGQPNSVTNGGSGADNLTIISYSGGTASDLMGATFAFRGNKMSGTSIIKS